MECRYLKQKCVASGEGWRRGLCHFLLDFFEDGMQIPETKVLLLDRNSLFHFLWDFLKTECRCPKQKSVAKGEGCRDYVEDGMQIPGNGRRKTGDGEVCFTSCEMFALF